MKLGGTGMGNPTERLLDEIARLLAANLTRGRKQVEVIEDLERCGIEPKRIAEFLGTTRNTVNVALANIRRKKRKR